MSRAALIKLEDREGRYVGRNGDGRLRGVYLSYNQTTGETTINAVNTRGISHSCFLEIPMSIQLYEKLVEVLKEVSVENKVDQ